MSHNDDEHVQVTVGSSKTTLIRGKESGRLLTEDNDYTYQNGGVNTKAVKDVDSIDLLKQILAELKKHTLHFEKITDEEF